MKWMMQILLALTLLPALGFAQQPQAQQGQPLYAVNAKYVNGVAPGYWPTAGAGLTLNIAAGTAICGNPPVKVDYAGGTLTMTNAATNYVYLDPTATCAPAFNITGFAVGQIPLAKVVTGASAITSVTDVRSWFVPLPCVMSATGAIQCSALGTDRNIELKPSGAGNVLVPRLNNIRFADQFPGADLGAKINAADAALGSDPGEIWVTTSGTLATQVSLTSNHTLRLLGNITVNVPTPILIPYTASGVAILGSGYGTVLNNTQTTYNGASWDEDCITIGTYTGGYHATAGTNIATGDIAAGSTTLTVVSSAGFVAGQDLLIIEGAGYRYAEWNKVASTGAGTITLSWPTENKYRLAPDGATTGVYGFNVGVLTKNFEVAHLRITSTTSVPSATGSGSGVGVYTAIEGKIHDLWIDHAGSRGIVVGASGYPAGRVQVTGNHIQSCGLVPAAGGSPSLEVYVLSSHVTFDANEVWYANGHGIAVHGLHHIISNNQVWFTANAGAGFSVDTAEAIVFSNNIVSEAAGNGFQLWGSTAVDTVEASRITLAGNTAKDCGGSGFSIAMFGSGGYVLAFLRGNFAYRNRGNAGFDFYVSVPVGAVDASGNTAEGNVAGFKFENANMGGLLTSNVSRLNTAGFDLHSPVRLVFLGNTSDYDTTGVALGAATYSYFSFNQITNAGTISTGTIDNNSMILANNFTGIIGQITETINSLTVAKSITSGLNTVAFSATPIFDASLGNTQKITLTDNVTSSTLSYATAGQTINFIICQDATGSRTFVWPTNVLGGMTIGSTASKCSAQAGIFDGTNLYMLSAGVINM